MALIPKLPIKKSGIKDFFPLQSKIPISTQQGDAYCSSTGTN